MEFYGPTLMSILILLGSIYAVVKLKQFGKEAGID